MPGQPGIIVHDRTPIATQFPGHGGMYDLTTEGSFDSQVIMCLAYF